MSTVHELAGWRTYSPTAHSVIVSRRRPMACVLQISDTSSVYSLIRRKLTSTIQTQRDAETAITQPTRNACFLWPPPARKPNSEPAIDRPRRFVYCTLKQRRVPATLRQIENLAVKMSVPVVQCFVSAFLALAVSAPLGAWHHASAAVPFMSLSTTPIIFVHSVIKHQTGFIGAWSVQRQTISYAWIRLAEERNGSRSVRSIWHYFVWTNVYAPIKVHYYLCCCCCCC